MTLSLAQLALEAQALGLLDTSSNPTYPEAHYGSIGGSPDDRTGVDLHHVGAVDPGRGDRHPGVDPALGGGEGLPCWPAHDPTPRHRTINGRGIVGRLVAKVTP